MPPITKIEHSLLLVYIALASTSVVGCDSSTSPEPCLPGDGIVSIVSRGTLNQNGCTQYIGASQDASGESPTGNVIVTIENSQFNPETAAYSNYLNSVALYSEFEDGALPLFAESLELSNGTGEGWVMSFERDDTGYADVQSGTLLVEIDPAVPAMTATFESVFLEWPNGEADTISGDIQATLDIHCKYCEQGTCDPDSSVPDSWPPTSEYCQELEAALLGS
jgi:hypothetical protein